MSKYLRVLTRKMSSKGKKSKEKEKSLKTNNNDPVTFDKSGNICIKVLAKPGAKQNGITSISEEGIGVQIAAPPVEGEANTELVKYIAKVLSLRKSDVILDRGSKSRHKTLQIMKDVTTIESVLDCLKREQSS